MIQGPTTNPFYIFEDLWARESRFGRTYLDENIKSLFVHGLILSINPNARRYWADHPAADIYSLLNYARSRMQIPRVESFFTPRLTSYKRLSDTRSTTLSQIVDVDDEVVKQAYQTDILAIM